MKKIALLSLAAALAMPMAAHATMRDTTANWEREHNDAAPAPSTFEHADREQAHSLKHATHKDMKSAPAGEKKHHHHKKSGAATGTAMKK